MRRPSRHGTVSLAATLALATLPLAPLRAGAGRATHAPVLESAPALPGPVELTTLERDSLTAAILKDRADTETWLQKSPSSYLATILRRDFGDRLTLSVGRDSGNDVRIADPALAPRHLSVTVVGDSFRVEPLEPGATYTVNDSVRRTASTLPPSNIGVGRYRIRLSHQRFPALIVFDPRSPRFKEYKGIKYFPVDLAWRFAVPLTPAPDPDTVIILSTRGNPRRAVVAGWFEFKVGGKPCRLMATRLLEPGVGEQDVSVFFRDLTTGAESYPVGRYVDPERMSDGRYLIDFNLAYSPACAYSRDYNCPIPPRENKLPVAVKAGEMDSHYMGH